MLDMDTHAAQFLTGISLFPVQEKILIKLQIEWRFTIQKMIIGLKCLWLIKADITIQVVVSMISSSIFSEVFKIMIRSIQTQ